MICGLKEYTNNLESFNLKKTRSKIAQKNMTQLLSKVGTWISWRLFNIIVILCDVPNFKERIIVHSALKIQSKVSKFTSQIMTMILNNLQLVYVPILLKS